MCIQQPAWVQQCGHASGLSVHSVRQMRLAANNHSPRRSAHASCRNTVISSSGAGAGQQTRTHDKSTTRPPSPTTRSGGSRGSGEASHAGTRGDASRGSPPELRLDVAIDALSEHPRRLINVDVLTPLKDEAGRTTNPQQHPPLLTLDDKRVYPVRVRSSDHELACLHEDIECAQMHAQTRRTKATTKATISQSISVLLWG